MGYLPGVFTKIPGPGLFGYIGTTKNGVTTTNYGSYASSFYLHKGIMNIGNLNIQTVDPQLKPLQN
jgi:hypothetical protein